MGTTTSELEPPGGWEPPRWAAHLAGQGKQPLDVVFTAFGFIFSG